MDPELMLSDGKSECDTELEWTIYRLGPQNPLHQDILQRELRQQLLRRSKI